MFGEILGTVGKVLGIAGGVKNLLGDGGLSQSDIIDRQATLQKEFAQNGIRWRVEDAKAAGIHPLFALGGPGASFSPVATFGDGPSVGDRLSNLGQDISRAVDSTRTAPERASARLEALAIERGELENDLLRSRLALMNQQSGPPMPTGAAITYDGPGSAVLDQPLSRVVHTPEGQELGAVADVGYAQTATGLVPIPSKDIKERIEDNTVQELLHAFRNNLIPTLGGGSPPPIPLPEGQRWVFNPAAQEWQRRYTRELEYGDHESWRIPMPYPPVRRPLSDQDRSDFFRRRYRGQ